MARASVKVASSSTIFLLLIVLLNYNLHSEAKKQTWNDTELIKHDGTLKSIKVDDDYIIDCVDIYKQPAFNHPLLKNHTIKDMVKAKPSKKEGKKRQKICQTWHKNGRCPKGTVPIRRTRKESNITKPSPFDNRHVIPNLACTQKTAGVFTKELANTGASAFLTIWNPYTELNDFSLSEVAVYYKENGAPLEIIEVGLHVNQNLYGDSYTHFFVYWTADNYRSTGCYNSLCPGFVLTDSSFELGGKYPRTSDPHGDTLDIEIDIIQDRDTTNWELYVDGAVIGYWPSTLLTNLENGGNYAAWFGHVEDCNQIGSTTTDMGSGYFPTQGPGVCAFMDEFQIIETDGTYRRPDREEYDEIISHPQCYDLETLDDGTILYGGPGRSNTC